MGTTVEARNWECPRLSLSTQLSWKLGKARLSARKIRNHHYFQAEDTGKYERALAQRKEAIDHLRKSEILFKKLHFPLDFFFKKWYHINIETLWCTTSHLSVDRLFFVLLGKQSLLTACRPSHGNSFS